MDDAVDGTNPRLRGIRPSQIACCATLGFIKKGGAPTRAPSTPNIVDEIPLSEAGEGLGGVRAKTWQPSRWAPALSEQVGCELNLSRGCCRHYFIARNNCRELTPFPNGLAGQRIFRLLPEEEAKLTVDAPLTIKK